MIPLAQACSNSILAAFAFAVIAFCFTLGLCDGLRDWYFDA